MSGRWAAVTKSPLTGTVTDSHQGGLTAARLHWAGLDGLVFSGRSERPVYAFVEDGEVSLRDASETWAMGIHATVGIAIGNLGNVHQALGDFQKAISCQERALALMKQLGSHAGVGRALGNLGLTYSDMGEFAKALSYMEQSLALREKIGDRAGVAATLGNIGGVYEWLGDSAKALSYAERGSRFS